MHNYTYTYMCTYIYINIPLGCCSYMLLFSINYTFDSYLRHLHLLHSAEEILPFPHCFQ